MPRRLTQIAALAAAALPGALLVPSAAGAARSWVKGDLILNVRTGPGVENRPLGAITTGDPVEVLEQTEGWTRVRSEKSGEGWIPSGFLQEQPPAVVRLQEIESEATALRKRVEELAAEAESLRATHSQAAAREAEQAREIERLSEQNATLQSDVIWPVMIVGAAILATGGLIGAWLRNPGRRPAARVRL